MNSIQAMQASIGALVGRRTYAWRIGMVSIGRSSFAAEQSSRECVPISDGGHPSVRSTMVKAAATLLLFAMSAFAIMAASLSVANVRGYPGEILPVGMRLSRATNVTALQFDIRYDLEHAMLRPWVSSAQLSNHIVLTKEISPNVRRHVIYSLGNRTFPQRGLTLGSMGVHLEPGERDGSGPIIPQNAILARPDGSELTPVSASTGRVFISPVFLDPDRGALFFLPSEVDRTYVVQASTNLLNWVNIATNTASSYFLDLVDSDAPLFPRRYYRSILSDSITGNPLVNVSLVENELHINFPTIPQSPYELEASIDLQNWEFLGRIDAKESNTLVRPSFDARIRYRFFRLRSIE